MKITIKLSETNNALLNRVVKEEKVDASEFANNAFQLHDFSICSVQKPLQTVILTAVDNILLGSIQQIIKVVAGQCYLVA